MPPKKPKAPKPEGAAQNGATSKDAPLSDQELKELKSNGKGKAAAKVQKPPRRGGKKGSPSWMQHALSLLAVIAAVAATYLFTRSSPEAPPRSPLTASDSGADGSWVRDECESWKEDGECENNPGLMRQKCPGTCKPKKKKAKKAKEEQPPPDDGPPDKSEHCGVWAAAGECEKNPAYMMDECAASCRSGGKAESKSVDLHQVPRPPLERAGEKGRPSPAVAARSAASAAWWWLAVASAARLGPPVPQDED